MKDSSSKATSSISRTISENLGISGTKIVLDQNVSLLRRTFWLVLVLSMFGVMVYQISHRVRTFLSNPVAVNIKMQYENTVRFPVILICNMNLITLSGTYGYNNEVNQFKLLQDYMSVLQYDVL